MALPTSRDLTAAPGKQVPSALANNLQDAIIGKQHGAVWHRFPAASWADLGAGTGAYTSSGGGVGPYWQASAGNFSVYLIPHFPIGSVIEEIAMFWRDNGVTRMKLVGLIGNPLAPSESTLLDLQSSGAAGRKKETFDNASDPDLPYTVIANENLQLLANFNSNTGANFRFFGAEILISKPT